MNKERRKKIYEVVAELEKQKDILGELKNEEDDYRDCMPENLMNSFRYEESEEASYALDDAIVSIEEAVETIEGSI